MKIKNLLPALFVLLYFSDANAQADHYEKLELKKGKTFIVGPSNVLIVDTLIMQDKSTIQFAPDIEGTLIVRAAYIGEKATITSRGANGKNSTDGLTATNGENGGHLAADIHFIKLGSLLLDTRGGNGGNGGVGKKGTPPSSRSVPVGVSNSGGVSRTVYATQKLPGTPGTPGTPNGTGGNGGNITLTYTTTDLLVTVRNNPNSAEAEHKLTLLSRAGKSGRPGKGGTSYSEYNLRSIEGSTVTTLHSNGQDGHIDVTKVDKALK